MDRLDKDGNILFDGVGFEEIHSKDIEVIGNIYENPELLETKK